MSIYYDPMISKFAVYGRDRAEAIDRMRRALMEYEVGGIKTTLPFFREIMVDEEFIAGNLDTGFIAAFNERRKPVEADQGTRDMAVIAAAIAYSEKQRTTAVSNNGGQATSQWAMSGRAAAMKNRI